MLDIKFIRQNEQKVREAIRNRGFKVDLDDLMKLDKQRRELIQQTEKLKSELNNISKEKPDQATIKRAKDIKGKIKKTDKELTVLEEKYQQLMRKVPNIPQNDVPVGKDSSANKIIKEWGDKPGFDFKPKDYLTISENLGLIDVKRAAKTSGSRFGFIKREAALLEFALVQLALSVLKGEGFTAVVPPVMLKPEAMGAMGYLDSHGDEIYHLEKDDLYLVGTSEQSIGPMHMEETFRDADLPKRYVAFSTCFRREAGSYGKDTKGILRVHQFDKAEMFSFCKAEESEKEHQFLLSLQEKLVQLLELPYRVSILSTGDIGAPSSKTYDIECWLPGQNEFRETHSTSNCTSFQARRLNTRYKTADNKTEFVHTLNGTAFAIGRMIIAIIENYQEKDGSVKIPRVLQKYLDLEKIEKK